MCGQPRDRWQPTEDGFVSRAIRLGDQPHVLCTVAPMLAGILERAKRLLPVAVGAAILIVLVWHGAGCAGHRSRAAQSRVEEERLPEARGHAVIGEAIGRIPWHFAKAPDREGAEQRPLLR